MPKPGTRSPEPPAPPEPVAPEVQLRAAFAEQFAPPPPPPPSPESVPLEEGADDELSAGLEELANTPGKLSELTEEEIADLAELLFGLVAEGRGAHWELQRRRALRIGKWAKKTIDRYGGVPESWGKHIPALIFAAILGMEIKSKLDQDAALQRPALLPEALPE